MSRMAPSPSLISSKTCSRQWLPLEDSVTLYFLNNIQSVIIEVATTASRAHAFSDVGLGEFDL